MQNVKDTFMRGQIELITGQLKRKLQNSENWSFEIVSVFSIFLIFSLIRGENIILAKSSLG